MKGEIVVVKIIKRCCRGRPINRSGRLHWNRSLKRLATVIVNGNAHATVNTLLRRKGLIGPFGIVYKLGQLIFKRFEYLLVFVACKTCIYNQVTIKLLGKRNATGN